MAVTLKEIRRAVGDKTGDLLVLKATATSATAGTFIDTVRLGDRGNNAPSLVNRLGYFSGGTAANLTHEVRTTGFVANTRTLAFTPDATVPPEPDDEMELWSIADRTGSIDGLHRLINVAIRSVEDLCATEVYDDDGATTFNMRSPYLTIPSTWIELGGAEWTTPGNLIKDIPKQQALVRTGRRTVEIMGRAGINAHGRTVTLWGYTPAAQLVDDDDETTVDIEWLVETVASVMTLGQSWRATDRAAEERRANFWAVQRDLFRRKVGKQRRGWGILLP